MNIKDADKALNNLAGLAQDLGVYNKLAARILGDIKFRNWTGSGYPEQHHYGDYGLIVHTNEVVETCFAMKDQYPQYDDISDEELYLAALFHDVGKTYDYSKAADGSWSATPHKRHVNHINRSAIIWEKTLDHYETFVTSDDGGSLEHLRDPVLHAILSHHGRRAWGSPVAPKTRVAWILHLSDGISARLYDCHTLDRLD
jgi:3'-5' exoribonuclease